MRFHGLVPLLLAVLALVDGGCARTRGTRTCCPAPCVTLGKVAAAPAPSPSTPPVARTTPRPMSRVAEVVVVDPDAAALPVEVTRVENPRPWTVIALHHSATERGGMAAFDAMHRARGWDGVGYDFVIGNGTDTADGALETTFRWREQREGAHVKGWNEIAIGICLVGNFEETEPTAAQLATLSTLVRHLRRRFSIPRERVVGHGRLGNTLCPGKRFPLATVLEATDPKTDAKPDAKTDPEAAVPPAPTAAPRPSADPEAEPDLDPTAAPR